MIQYLARILGLSVFCSVVLKIANVFFLLCINGDYRIAGLKITVSPDH